jgi:Tol biopolymer transport system component
MNSSRRPGVRAAAFAVLVAAAAIPAPAAAQYFGQNKVQYEKFDFQVLKTEHYDIYYYPEEQEATKEASRMAERWYTRLSELLDHDLSRRQPLVLYDSHPAFEQTNVIEGTISESTGGVTEGLRNRVVLPFAGPLAETDHVLGHELVHAFQYDIGNQFAGGRGLQRLPLWFVEGMAEYLSLGPVDPQTAMWLRDAALREKLPSIRDLNNPRYFPYRFGQALWAFIGGRWGDDVIGDAFRIAAQSGDPEHALRQMTGLDEQTLSAEWKASILNAYKPVLTAPPDTGRVVLSEAKDGGRLNIAPALSPDGRKMVFLSEKDLFSIDVFLADVETGKIDRKIVSTSADPHFDSLQFINSAGSWDRSGQRFAFAGIHRGRPILSFIDVASGRRVQEATFRELGEIFQPTWSPDGKRVAFSAIKGGLTDLFVYELATGTLRQLTKDAWADLQPAWAPDGSRIAFVTDRFSSNFETLAFGDYRLAMIDVASARIEPVEAFPHGKNINPQWSADGTALYFLANPDGVANVYKMTLAERRIERLTSAQTGVTGITALSPALSVASATDRVAYSVQSDSGYEIRVREGAARAEPVTTSLATEQPPAAVLPPPERKPGPVANSLQNGTTGLPATPSKDVQPYKAGLGLTYAGQGFGLGTDPLGTYASGGVYLLFSDMLGNHILATSAQVNGQVEDIGGEVAYFNRTNRWNWGLVGGQLPYRTGAFNIGLDEIDGQLVQLEQTLVFRQIDRYAMGILAYPFSRAQRVEFSSGYRGVGFDLEQRTLGFLLSTGQLVIDEETELPAPDNINMFEAGAALVYDTAVLGPTSPILGTRYRLDASPTWGDLSFTTVSADFRQYFVPVRPITIAGRLLHYGRYGRDSLDNRLVPLFLGYSNLVRGYDYNSFEITECEPTRETDCPVYDNLFGSRMLVGNVELRFPLFGIFKGEFDYGPIPLEGVVFGDAGVAYTEDDKPDFAGGSRDFVRSWGAGVRVNALGFAIFEIDAVKPLDRPQQGWMFTFNVRPGF